MVFDPNQSTTHNRTGYKTNYHEWTKRIETQNILESYLFSFFQMLYKVLYSGIMLSRLLS